jgi:hypothetical protein
MNCVPDSPASMMIIDGWAPGFGPACHRRSVGRAAIPGFVLIALGLALFLAAWAHRRNNHD